MNCFIRRRSILMTNYLSVISQVVITDNNPVALHYVPHLDQVWVLNWRSSRDQGVKTIQIIRDASQKRKHHTVHPEPIDGHFDLVRDLFMPPIQVAPPLIIAAIIPSLHCNTQRIRATTKYVR